MNKIIKQICIAFFVFSIGFQMLLIQSCAMVLKGYKDRVDLINPPEDLKVFTVDSVEIPVNSRSMRVYSETRKMYIDSLSIKSINLRSNKEHLLVLRSGEKKKVIEAYPKISVGWIVLDVLFGIVPLFFDAYTGDWNKFDPIYVQF